MHARLRVGARLVEVRKVRVEHRLVSAVHLDTDTEPKVGVAVHVAPVQRDAVHDVREIRQLVVLVAPAVRTVV